MAKLQLAMAKLQQAMAKLQLAMAKLQQAAAGDEPAEMQVSDVARDVELVATQRADLLHTERISDATLHF